MDGMPSGTERSAAGAVSGTAGRTGYTGSMRW